MVRGQFVERRTRGACELPQPVQVGVGLSLHVLDLAVVDGAEKRERIRADLSDSLIENRGRCNYCHPTSRSANPTLRITIDAAPAACATRAASLRFLIPSRDRDSCPILLPAARQLTRDRFRLQHNLTGRRAPRAQRREQHLEPRFIHAAAQAVRQQRDAILDRTPVAAVGQQGETPPEPGHDFIHEV
ncbi:MAG: hypothetical protein AAB349_03430, partial [Chloroflexota bacterium]